MEVRGSSVVISESETSGGDQRSRGLVCRLDCEALGGSYVHHVTAVQHSKFIGPIVD
jgi:hypothetical protein